VFGDPHQAKAAPGLLGELTLTSRMSANAAWLTTTDRLSIFTCDRLDLAVTGWTISAVNSHKVRRHQFHKLKSYPIVSGAWSENFSAL
jgi:hypothetical protein